MKPVKTMKFLPVPDVKEAANRTAIPGLSSNRVCARGFSLIELMIGLLLSAILLGALFTVLVRVQEMTAALSDSVENRTNRNMAPLLFSQWIKCAGMNLPGSPEEFLTAGVDELGVKADIKGDHGMSDGDTDDSFEEISLRSRNDELRIKSGNGNYQPFLKGITGFRGSREGESLLKVELLSKDDYLDSGSITETRLWLWNTRANLFPEVQP